MKSQNLSERIAYAQSFKEKLARAQITHFLYVKARDELHAFTSLAPPGKLIFAVGASGSGKTTAARHTIATQQKADKDDRYEHLISTEVTSTVSAQYAISRLQSQLLIKLRHPIYGRSLWEPTSKTRTPPYKLDEALRQALVLRKTIGLWADEAHLLFKTESTNLMRANADALKGLVSPGLDDGHETGLKCYLAAIGGYLLLTRGLESSHFNRRVQVVHFERYKLTPPHLKAFTQALELLDAILPLSEGFRLSGNAEFFYEHSHGVFGVVVDWCYWALGQMCTREKGLISIKDFAATRLRLGKHETLAELEIGENLAEKLACESATDAQIKAAFKEARELERDRAAKERSEEASANDGGNSATASTSCDKPKKGAKPFKKAKTRLHSLAGAASAGEAKQ